MTQENQLITSAHPSELAPKKIVKMPWGAGGVVALMLSYISGLVYLAAQFWILQDVKDPYFIGVLIANTFAIHRFAKFLRWYLGSKDCFLSPILQDAGSYATKKGFLPSIFGGLWPFAFGIGFGAIISAGTVLLAPWQDPFLLYSLAAFLFFANVVTGLAVYSIGIYINHSQLIAQHVLVSLWDRSNPAVAALLQTSRYLVLAAAFIACLGTLAVMFSVFEIGIAVMTFSGFSAVMVLTIYAAPLYPLMLRISQIKKNNLNSIEQKIQAEYNFIIEAKSTKDIDLELTDFYNLLKLRQTILSVRTTAIAGKYSLGTAVPVLALTMLPSIIDYVLKTYL